MLCEAVLRHSSTLTSCHIVWYEYLRSLEEDFQIILVTSWPFIYPHHLLDQYFKNNCCGGV